METKLQQVTKGQNLLGFCLFGSFLTHAHHMVLAFTKICEARAILLLVYLGYTKLGKKSMRLNTEAYA